MVLYYITVCYGAACMYSALGNIGVKREIRVFTNIEAAVAWLDTEVHSDSVE